MTHTSLDEDREKELLKKKNNKSYARRKERLRKLRALRDEAFDFDEYFSSLMKFNRKEPVRGRKI